MTNVPNICDAIGRRELAERLGVGVTAISNASVAGVFPARWYVVIKAVCDEANLECPYELFTFVRSDQSREHAA